MKGNLNFVDRIFRIEWPLHRLPNRIVTAFYEQDIKYIRNIVSFLTENILPLDDP